MPPPTPSTTFLVSAPMRQAQCPLFSRCKFLRLPLHRIRALHQTAPYFLHGSHGGLLGCGWEERTSAILQLPRALSGHDDEPVGALLDIVRNGVHRVVS